jgi:hypothetical protein
MQFSVSLLNLLNPNIVSELYCETPSVDKASLNKIINKFQCNPIFQSVHMYLQCMNCSDINGGLSNIKHVTCKQQAADTMTGKVAHLSCILFGVGRCPGVQQTL